MAIKRITTWDENGKLPLLILTTNGRYGNQKNPDDWCEIEHQGGGYACTQFKQECIILPIKDSVFRDVVDLTDKWIDSCVGMTGGPSLSAANQYSEDLKQLGLSCEISYRLMMEGVYPFDTSAATLRTLTDYPLPDDLDELLVFKSDLEKAFGILSRWQAYILGENCD